MHSRRQINSRQSAWHVLRSQVGYTNALSLVQTSARLSLVPKSSAQSCPKLQNCRSCPDPGLPWTGTGQGPAVDGTLCRSNRPDANPLKIYADEKQNKKWNCAASHLGFKFSWTESGLNYSCQQQQKAGGMLYPTLTSTNPFFPSGKRPSGAPYTGMWGKLLQCAYSPGKELSVIVLSINNCHKVVCSRFFYFIF